MPNNSTAIYVRKASFFVSAVWLAISASVPAVLATEPVEPVTGGADAAAASVAAELQNSTTLIHAGNFGELGGNLTVNEGQTVVFDVGGLNGILNFGANSITNNGGTIVALSSNAAITSATFNVGGLYNSGLFTSVIPTGGIAGIDTSMMVATSVWS